MSSDTIYPSSPLFGFQLPWERKPQSGFQLFGSLPSETAALCALEALETPRHDDSPRRTIRKPSFHEDYTFSISGSEESAETAGETSSPIEASPSGSPEPRPRSSLERLREEVEAMTAEMPRSTAGSPRSPKCKPVSLLDYKVAASHEYGFLAAAARSSRASELFRSSEADGELAGELLPRCTKICRHYLRGHCKRGADCNFLHDPSVFKPDAQKVFLGGLPKGITTETLIHELRKQGQEVLNRPKIHPRGFTPKCLLGSPEAARALVKKGKIKICGKKVDVRRYKDKNGMGVPQRSVFIGGLAPGTTGLDIARALYAIGFMSEAPPVVRDGYAPKVILSTTDQANALIILGYFECKGRNVDVRPWVSRSRRH